MDSGRLETVPSGAVNIDTVRALHQTVVSLRTALEVSKNELKQLKQKYEQHSISEYTELIEKLTLENHVLRRKLIDPYSPEKQCNTQNLKLEVTYSPRNVDEFGSKVVIQTATTDLNNTVESATDHKSEEDSKFCSTQQLKRIQEERLPTTEFIDVELSPEEDQTDSKSDEAESEPNSQIFSFSPCSDHHQTFKTKLELLSKFDVRIKVRSLTEGTAVSNTSDSESSTAEKNKKKTEKESDPSIHFEEKRKHFKDIEDQKGNKVFFQSVSTEDIKMAVPNEAEAKTKVDKLDVQVRITSEESVVVKQNVGDKRRNKDALNLDVDALSLRSLSEGDNSVFSDTVVTPVDTSPVGEKDYNGSDNESEEVDDIELIFTADESKDMSNLQEDLVSIRETEPWVPPSEHSTPVLIKFHTLDPDFQPDTNADTDTENRTAEHCLKKRVSLPSEKDFRHVGFSKGSLDLPGRGILKSCYNKSDNMLYKRSPNTSTRRLDSVDSLTCEYNRGLSFDNTKSSSFELGSSMDILHESAENFRLAHLGHRFSVYAETDISKCGISEEDLGANLNARRNTCPNPFQYRPSTHRGVSRPPGPFKAGSRLRPVLRESNSARRDSGAQTEVSALPSRARSESHLAYKMLVTPPPPPSVPNRPFSRRLTAAVARPENIRDDSRRLLLSDIGFTSMVPELSRSADPVWALGKLAAADTTPAGSGGTSKYLSRGCHRSPLLSIDRSNEWTPQTIYVPVTKVVSRPWRSSMPDVRRDDTDELMEETDNFLRRSIQNLHSHSFDSDRPPGLSGQPYLPNEPRHLRLGHDVKVITPQGRVAVGRVRYVGIAGGTAATSSVVVGAEFPTALNQGLPRNDGTYRGRRYFLTPPHYTALFVPFSKVVLAWAN